MRPGGRQYIPRPSDWRAGAPAPWAEPSAFPGAGEIAARLTDTPAAQPDARPVGTRAAAVLVALLEGPDGVEVLLTKRSDDLSSHRGEISFPGGRLDPGESWEAAARREAAEEVGLDSGELAVVGYLSPVITPVSGSFIMPVVGVVGRRPALRAASAEVARIMWVGLRDFTLQGTYRQEVWNHPLARELHFFHLDDETVWGATARMLNELLRLALDLPAPAAG